MHPYLFQAYPELVKEWHPTKNVRLFEDVTCGSSSKIWWRCSNNASHEWQQSVKMRVRQAELHPERLCPHCELERYNLVTEYPEIAAEWHSTLNGDSRPELFLPKSTRLAWWVCRKNTAHVWQTSVSTRTSGRNCPLCSGNKVDNTNSLATIAPEIAKQWHRTKNGALTSQNFTSHSRALAWWQCPADKTHYWKTTIYNRTNGHGCPFCTGRFGAKGEMLSDLFPEVAAEWHPTKNRFFFSTPLHWHARKNRAISPTDHPKKNRRLRPSDICFGSNEVAWWKCSKNHEWQAKVSDRTRKGTSCPKCMNTQVHDGYNLAVLWPKLTRLWFHSRNAPLKPVDVMPGSNQIVWWRCAKNADHVFRKKISSMTRSWTEGHSGCPMCAGKKLITSNSLQNKMPSVAKMWHVERNLPITSLDVSPGSRLKIWWQCPQSSSHRWRAPVSKVVASARTGNTGCPFCRGIAVTESESLPRKYPEIMQYWSKNFNETLDAARLGPGSHKIASWQCPSDSAHVWQLSIRNMVKRARTGKTLCLLCRNI